MKTKILRRTVVSVFVLVALAILLTAGTRVALPANIIVVTNTNDSGPGSLRDALAIANDGDTIDATGVSGTILLTTGELQIIHNVTINGSGAGNLAVDGNAISRVFENFASNATISDLTLTNGLTVGNTASNNGGGGILNHGGLTLTDSSVSNSRTPFGRNQYGGGIFNDVGATLTVTGSTIVGNHAGCAGGGIYSNNAQLTVTNSIISGNGAGSFPLQCFGTGAGIFYSGEGTMTVRNSIISGNRAGGPGGGMALGGTGTTIVTDSTITGNGAGGTCESCGDGGGIYHYGHSLTLANTTISDNWAHYGGGVWGGSLIVTNSTISGNSASRSFSGGIEGYGTLTITNSSLSGNSNGIWNFGKAQIGDTIFNAGEFGETILNNGTVTSLGYNLASDDGGGVLNGPGDQINTDPMLGPLQDNGGPTFTHALLPGSPAINRGNPSFTSPPSYDQRGPGFNRVVNGRIDIGSFEVQTVTTPTPTPTATRTPTPTSTPTATPRPTPTARPSPSGWPRPTPAPRM